MRPELQQFKTHDPANLSGTLSHASTWLSHTSQSTAQVQALRLQQIQVSTTQIVSFLSTVRCINMEASDTSRCFPLKLNNGQNIKLVRGGCVKFLHSPKIRLGWISETLIQNIKEWLIYLMHYLPMLYFISQFFV